MKDYDTIYLFVKDRHNGKKMKAGKASSQVAHAVGLLASHFPAHWYRHISAGQRAVTLKCKELPIDMLVNTDAGASSTPTLLKLNEVGMAFMNGFRDFLYASVYDHTDGDVFVLAVLPQDRLDLPQYDIL